MRIHAQVELKSAAPEPRTSSPSQIRGLHFLRQPQHARVEGSRRRFLALRHRKLDVIEIDDFTHNSILQSDGMTNSRTDQSNAYVPLSRGLFDTVPGRV